jgi:putative ABC transport system ATP-binding protein
MMMIQVHSLQFKYESAKAPTLLIPSFEVKKGERLFLYGASGSGKSTLLEILAGVLVAQKGQVKILDKDLNQLKAKSRDAFRAAHIGYIFQSFNLIPYLSVEENILLPLSLSPERASKVKDPKAEVLNICRELNIEKFLAKTVTELSVGQQQRVAVARALLGNPELILADEPTSALDYDQREKFIKLLFSVCDAHQTTLVFVSHDRSLEKLFSRSVSLSDMNQASKTGSDL